jgi:predicted dehydrogenase
MADRLKMGILGVGPIAQIAHLPALKKAANVDLVALCDASEELGARMAAAYGVGAVYTDHHRFLAEADVDAVLIPVAHEFHAPLALDALRAGKHVLVEKPMAVTVAECEQMVAAAEESGRQLGVAFMKRRDPSLEFAQRFVEAEMGLPMTVSGWYCDSQFHGQYVQSLHGDFAGGSGQRRPEPTHWDPMVGNLLGHGVHLIDTLRYFGGDIVAVTAGGYHEGRGTVAAALFEYASGAVGTFELVCTVKMDWCEGVRIHGEHGSVSARIPFPYYGKASEVEVYDDHRKEYRFPPTPDSDQYERQAEAFAAAILEGRPVSPSGYDGLAAQQVAYAVKQSQVTGRRVTLT